MHLECITIQFTIFFKTTFMPILVRILLQLHCSASRNSAFYLLLLLITAFLIRSCELITFEVSLWNLYLLKYLYEISIFLIYCL